MTATQFAYQRIVRGAAAVLTIALPDQNGEPRAPLGPVTVEVVASDGTVTVAAGAVTSLNDDNSLSFDLPASATGALDVLTVTWTEAGGTVIDQRIEVVGGHYFTIFDVRATDKVLRAENAVVKYPDEDILRVRQKVAVEMERITGRSFVPRFRYDTERSPGGGRSNNTALGLSQVDVRDIRWVKVNGVTYAQTYWELAPGGQLYFGSGIGFLPEQIANGPRRGNLPILIQAGYEYGVDAPPDDLKAAMITRVRSFLLGENVTGVPDRATSMSADGNTYSLSTPGIDGAMTGIPSVDEVYSGYRRSDLDDSFVASLRIV